jgi:hypothetical protein
MVAKLHGDFSVSERGQALLIVVLVMVIALTVGLSLASRSITNLRNSTDEANSQSAFAAAEAGVEQAVKLGNVTGSSVLSGVDFNDKNKSQISNVDIETISGDEFLLNNGNPVFQDDGQDVWLSTHTEDPAQLFQTSWPGTLYVYWGTSNDITGCSDPAMEVLLIFGTRTSPSMQKYVYDQCASRRNINHFSALPVNASGSFPVNGANGSITFNYKVPFPPITPLTTGLLARIIPLYKAGSIGIKGANLPIQGKIITSIGTAGSTGTETVRKISFFQGYESLPSEFFFSLFTPR